MTRISCSEQDWNCIKRGRSAKGVNSQTQYAACFGSSQQSSGTSVTKV